MIARTTSRPDDESPRSSGRSGLRVLLADDQPDILVALQLLLKAEGFETESAGSPEEIRAAIERSRFQVVLMDLNYSRDTTSGQEGLDLLEQMETMENAPPVVVMTAWGSIDLAVEAMRRGAKDFVLKPWDNDRLIETLLKHTSAELPGEDTPSDADRYSNREMVIARRVQTKLLPQTMPPMETLDYAGRCWQANAVGGDYYDFLKLAPGRLGLVLADVSGKGIPAALLMANLQASLRGRSELALKDLPLLLESINRLFYESTELQHYATLFFGDYDDRARRLRYVNCGHQPPILLRHDGRAEHLASTATVMGLFPQFSCEVREVDVGRGDTLVVFSDGVTDARGEDGEELGDERLLSLLRTQLKVPVDALPAALTSSLLESFQQTDDLTLVVARGK